MPEKKKKSRKEQPEVVPAQPVAVEPTYEEPSEENEYGAVNPWPEQPAQPVQSVQSEQPVQSTQENLSEQPVVGTQPATDRYVMPEDERKKYGENADIIEQGENYFRDTEKDYNERIKKVEDMNSQLANIRAKNYASFADYVKDVQNAAKVDENEIRDDERANRKTSIYTGVSEFANALIGLVGTLAGANPIKTSSYASDWMKRADQNRENLRRSRRANNETYARLSNQLTRLQSSNDAESVRDRYRLENLQLAAKKDLNLLRGNLDRMKTGAVKQVADNAIKERNADTAAARAAAAAANKGHDPLKGTIPLNVGDEILYIQPRAISENIKASIDSITDLSADDIRAIKLIKMTDKGNDYVTQLMPYIHKSSQLRKILRSVSAKSETLAPLVQNTDQPESAVTGVALYDTGAKKGLRKEEKKTTAEEFFK